MSENEEYKGYTIVMSIDEDPINPREEYDNLGIMSCYHDRYNLGDKKYSKQHVDLDEIVKDPKVFALGLYFNDHSTLVMHCDHDFTHDYDDGLVGYIWVTKEQVREEYSCKRITRKTRQNVLARLKAEVHEYSQYLEGDVWGYQIVGPRSGYCSACADCDTADCYEDFCDGCEDGEDLESGGGFFGQEYCLTEAKSMVDYYVKQSEKEKQAEIAPWMEIIPLHGGTPC